MCAVLRLAAAGKVHLRAAAVCSLHVRISADPTTWTLSPPVVQPGVEICPKAGPARRASSRVGSRGLGVPPAAGPASGGRDAVACVPRACRLQIDLLGAEHHPSSRRHAHRPASGASLEGAPCLTAGPVLPCRHPAGVILAHCTATGSNRPVRHRSWGKWSGSFQTTTKASVLEPRLRGTPSINLTSRAGGAGTVFV